MKLGTLIPFKECIRWYMTWGVVVQCARATRVQYTSPLISGNFDLAM